MFLIICQRKCVILFSGKTPTSLDKKLFEHTLTERGTPEVAMMMKQKGYTSKTP